MDLLTSDMLMHICPKLKKDRALTLANIHNQICPQYKINTYDRLQEFIATEAHESDEFTRKSENMNYSNADRIMEVFGKRYFTTRAYAQIFVKDPEALASYVYSSRMGNGHVQSHDGFKFRGGGFIQMTGRDMYTRFARYEKQDVNLIAEWVRTEDRWAVESACWVFAIEKQLLDEADADLFELITKRINGGTIGMPSRLKYYQRALEVLK